MTIEWNKVTWYSKIAAVVLFVGTFFLGFWLGTMKAEKVYVELPHVVYRNGDQSPSATAQASSIPNGPFDGPMNVSTSSPVLNPIFTESFSDATFGFSLRYPSSWNLSTSSRKYNFTYDSDDNKQYEDKILILQKGAVKIRIRNIGHPNSSCSSLIYEDHFYKQFDIGGHNAVIHRNPEINEPDIETYKAIQFQGEYYFPTYFSPRNKNGNWGGDCITKINNQLYSVDLFVPKEFSNDQLDEFIAIVSTLRWGM